MHSVSFRHSTSVAIPGANGFGLFFFSRPWFTIGLGKSLFILFIIITVYIDLRLASGSPFTHSAFFMGFSLSKECIYERVIVSGYDLSQTCAIQKQTMRRIFSPIAGEKSQKITHKKWVWPFLFYFAHESEWLTSFFYPGSWFPFLRSDGFVLKSLSPILIWESIMAYTQTVMVLWLREIFLFISLYTFSHIEDRGLLCFRGSFRSRWRIQGALPYTLFVGGPSAHRWR